MQPVTLRAALGALADIPRFFVWRLTYNDAKGKYDKVPWDGAARIDHQSPHHWMTFERAQELAHMFTRSDPAARYAIGWAFTEGCGYWFLDIDGCISPEGQYNAVATDWIAKAPGCFFEFSSSGKAVHVIGRGDMPPHGTRNKACGAEFYTKGRGVCFGLSGDAYGCADVAAPAMVQIVTDYFPPVAEGCDGDFDAPRKDWAGPADDAELLRRAMASASIAAKLGTKATFAQLYTNAPDLARFYGPDTDSERDAALASHLAFWTGCNAPRIERLMRSSALARPKWDEHRTYLRGLTITRACAIQKDVLQDRPRVDTQAEMYGVPNLPPLPQVQSAALPVLYAEPVPAAVGALIDSLLDMVHSASDWRDVHNRVIPAIRAAGVPPALMPRLENAVNKRLDIWDAKLPVQKLRGLLNPPRVAATDDSEGLMLKPEWAAHFVYIERLESFFDLRSSTDITATAFGAIYDRFMPIKGDGPGRQSAVMFMLQHWGTPVVYDTMYYPGRPTIFEYDSRKWANLYSEESLPTVADGYTSDCVDAIKRFQLHLFLLCDRRERVYQTVLAWMCHNVQKPGVKIRWVPIIKGIQGDGKSSIGVVMKAAMGIRNWMSVGPEVVCNTGGFTDWAHGQAVLVLEELYMTGKDRHRTSNMLKQFISNNDATINPKGAKPKAVLNTCNQIAFTNFPDAVPLDASKDRRWLVIFSPFGSREQMCEALGVEEDALHFDPIYASLSREPGQWRKWLQEMSVPEWFRPDSAPMHTAEKEVMAESGLDDVEMLARDIVENGAYGVSRDCLSSACLSRMMKLSAFNEGVEVPRGHSLHHMLNRMGFVRVAKQVKWDGTAHRAWLRNGIRSDDPEIVRELLDSTKLGQRA